MRLPTRGMKRLIVILILLCPRPAAADTARDLVTIWNDLDGMCRGWSSDDPRTQEVCAVREQAGYALDRLGWCYGRKTEAGAEMIWHSAHAIIKRPTSPCASVYAL